MLSNTTNPNPASLDNINGTMNRSPLHLRSNFNDNNASMRSTWIAPNSTPEAYQNDLIVQKSSFTAGVGQLGLSQVGHSRAVTGVQRTCISAQGVQIRHAVYRPSVQNHSVSYTSKVIILTKVIRTTYLDSPLSTMDRIMHQNGRATLQNQEPVFGDSFDSMANQVNTFNHANPYAQFINATAIISNQVTCKMQLSQFHNVQPSLIFNNVHVIGSMDSNMMQNVRASQSWMDTDVKDEQFEDPYYDGVTHSFPYRKYGPYTCPRCRKVFDRSQTFATHMIVHYKTESPAEKKRRQAAKYKHRGLQKIGATMKKCTTYPQTELTLSVKVKEEVENPKENSPSASI